MSERGEMALAFLLMLLVTSAAVGYAVYIAAMVMRADFYSRTQKVMQCVLILLLPVVGTILVHWFLRLHKAQPDKPDRAFVPQKEPNIDDIRGLH